MRELSAIRSANVADLIHEIESASMSLNMGVVGYLCVELITDWERPDTNTLHPETIIGLKSMIENLRESLDHISKRVLEMTPSKWVADA